MLTHSPDGYMAATDRHALAARLQTDHPGWMVWHGNASGLFNAVHPAVPAIVQTHTLGEMVQAIKSWQSWQALRSVGRRAHPPSRRERQ